MGTVLLQGPPKICTPPGPPGTRRLAQCVEAGRHQPPGQQGEKSGNTELSLSSPTYPVPAVPGLFPLCSRFPLPPPIARIARTGAGFHGFGLHLFPLFPVLCPSPAGKGTAASSPAAASCLPGHQIARRLPSGAGLHRQTQREGNAAAATPRGNGINRQGRTKGKTVQGAGGCCMA